MISPRATYRLQFRGSMDFDRAVSIVPYLRRLGVSHLYASPIFTAAAGSTHGYDITDHNAIDPALGGREGFERLNSALKQAGLGLILDIVPNHMAASVENSWWRDVVEWGRQSAFSGHFDIDWRERLTLPILGRPVDEVLGSGELALRLDRERGGLALGYFDNWLPLTPSSYRSILSQCDDPLAVELIQRAEAATPQTGVATQDQIKALLADGRAAARLEESLARLSRDHGLIKESHARQPWRLVFWKDARRHLSYRRFFEVTGLVGVRVEEPAVFDDVHRLILDLVRSGKVDGLRIDHVDGLADPGAYLERLRQEVGPDTYLVVEKILARDEALPSSWPIAGTTGYEFIATMADIFVDGGGAAELQCLHASIGGCADLEQERGQAKRLIVLDNFETELSALTDLAAAEAPDSPAHDIRAAIVELVVAFPVYRTYGNDRGLPDEDRDLLDHVAADARSSAGGMNSAALALVTALLTGDKASHSAAEFRRRFQQLTGPIMAKAVEDTLFYRCNHMIALNEVGNDPAEVAESMTEAHARLAASCGGASGLLATATHDTKRGEDARARLYALGEAPGIWANAVERWRMMHAGHIRQLADGPAPEPGTEWLFYQALAGVWPSEEPLDAAGFEALQRRFQPYVEKALREAKQRTDWLNVNEQYENVVKAYASKLLDPDNRRFHADFADTLRPFIRAGIANSLAQTLIKLTAPGIPDIYQGAESEDLSLVDPDNRQPVDFDHLMAQLSSDSRPLSVRSLQGGAAKQSMIAKCLAYRATREALFANGEYVPLSVSGERRDNIFAFMRSLGNDVAIVVVPRLILPLCLDGRAWGDEAFWCDTAVHLPCDLSATSLANVLGRANPDPSDPLYAADLFRDFPVALLAGS